MLLSLHVRYLFSGDILTLPSYRVERDGVEIGISENLNFTDTSDLEVGVNYVYTVTTIDVNGRESSEGEESTIRHSY